MDSLRKASDIWVMAMLIIGTLSDIKTKTVSYRYLAAAGTGSLLLSLLAKDPITAISGMIPGAFVYLFSTATGESIGKADALMIIFIGMTGGMERTCLMLMISLLIICPAGMILCALGKAGRRTRLPFFPFLSLSYLCCLLIDRIQI